MKKLLLNSVVFAGILLAVSCSQQTSENTEETTQDNYPVKVQEIQKREISRTITYTAGLHAYETIYLAPASPGRIDRIHVDVGDHVSKGQTLIEMDRSQLVQDCLLSAVLGLQEIIFRVGGVNDIVGSGLGGQAFYGKALTGIDHVQTAAFFEQPAGHALVVLVFFGHGQGYPAVRGYLI